MQKEKNSGGYEPAGPGMLSRVEKKINGLTITHVKQRYDPDFWMVEHVETGHHVATYNDWQEVVDAYGEEGELAAVENKWLLEFLQPHGNPIETMGFDTEEEIFAELEKRDREIAEGRRTPYGKWV